MIPENRSRRSARRRRLHVVGLEERTLLSVIPIVMGLGRMNRHPGASHSIHALAAGAAGGGGGASGGGSNGGSGSGGSFEMGTPTPHELARQQFIAKMTGTYTAGKGRFTNQAQQVFVLATGGSNQSLHMSLQLRLFVPTDPTLPTTGPTSLFAKDVANSGNTLVLDLTSAGPPNAQGIPTHYTWTVDPASGGLWQNVDGFGQGQGTLDIDFVPSGRGSGRVFSSGRAYLVFKGLINTSQTGNDLASPGNRPKGT